MKLIFVLGLLVLWSKGLGHADGTEVVDKPNGNNVFIITLDGFRWQELFKGADSAILNDPEFTTDSINAKALYWHPDPAVRREKLMPFVWSVIAKQGQLFGNRKYGNKVNTKNIYAVSYPGYNEIFTGAADPFVSTNKKIKNKNVNLLEYINKIPEYQNHVASFSSWNVFPYILNEERSKVYINCGYQPHTQGELTKTQMALNALQSQPQFEDQHERSDLLTFLAAREYILKNKPKVMHIGLGGTDSYGHQRKYDQYLKEANQADRIIADLWSLVQSMPCYKGNTTFIITTDHGRGNKTDTWFKHSGFVTGSSQTWIMLLGYRVKALGELKGNMQLFQKHIAGTVGYLLGVRSFSHKMLPVTSFEGENLLAAK
ncbi:alkaline phosphatase family protein [Flavisolibacter tropicus]|uniref:Metalloenzyme domain-containing protein n=1 Tax=Flavisolibacter tropicus TaxID=1492898 RepID=A0A172U1D0_9BACT|nr:alkaline phosphatase family protein [Flavisolibacter tropicus]ANE52924.1 hypothetical protein SY85_23030 [Flavisolibacter tropicus]